MQLKFDEYDIAAEISLYITLKTQPRGGINSHYIFIKLNNYVYQFIEFSNIEDKSWFHYLLNYFVST